MSRANLSSQELDELLERPTEELCRAVRDTQIEKVTGRPVMDEFIDEDGLSVSQKANRSDEAVLKAMGKYLHGTVFSFTQEQCSESGQVEPINVEPRRDKDIYHCEAFGSLAGGPLSAHQADYLISCLRRVGKIDRHK
jgi:hypothetical protein